MTSSAATAVPASGVADRSVLSGARRIVVKVGSSSLTSIKGGISEESLTALADALAAKRNSGTEIILVLSLINI
jgi:glutamate 5-kinase